MKYSFAQLEQIWVAGATRRGYSTKDAIARAPLMASIALAESAGEPDNVGHYPNAKPEGLWQINGKPFQGNSLNPVTNAEMAAVKLKSQGLGAWETYTNGNYKQFYTTANVNKAHMQNADFFGKIGEWLLENPVEQFEKEGGTKSKGIKEAEELFTEPEQFGEKIGKSAVKALPGGELLEALSEPQTWLRVAEGFGGVLLLYIALRQLSSRFEVSRTAVAQTRHGHSILVRDRKPIKAVGKATGKAASQATQAPARAKAAKSAHTRSRKFGGSASDARKATVRAAASKPSK